MDDGNEGRETLVLEEFQIQRLWAQQILKDKERRGSILKMAEKD